MQTLELKAAPAPEGFYPETLNIHNEQANMAMNVNLDDALAAVLQTVQKSESGPAIRGLGKLLAYMEMLEKAAGIGGNGGHKEIVLCAPLTLTL
ncbi:MULTISPECIES: hypothetical protein [Limnobacter]|uniref:Uncharacterized protein n=1 Tax=Limnobacter litoralis TaxID=481366 RepID=A0ABQ5YQJ0_9BURK|nr:MULTISPECIES: hypothetical protein [Limnobacter]GLR26883.1 hypothetical protein GCM10007875_19730 [Limnobacter litoralis]HEX5485300.1 hypothetical protein [Limnobacter sp.]